MVWWGQILETGCWWSLHNWYKLCHFNFSARRYQILTFSFHTFSICHNIWFLCTFLYFCLFACGPFSRCTQSPGHTINLFCRKLERGSQKMGSILHLQIIFGEKHNIYLLLHTRMNLEIKLVFLEKDEGVKLLRKLSQF